MKHDETLLLDHPEVSPSPGPSSRQSEQEINSFTLGYLRPKVKRDFFLVLVHITTPNPDSTKFCQKTNGPVQKTTMEGLVEVQVGIIFV